ncbi:hypothetical protein, partial [Actinotalea sp. JY-7885]
TAVDDVVATPADDREPVGVAGGRRMTIAERRAAERRAATAGASGAGHSSTAPPDGDDGPQADAGTERKDA